MYTFKSPSGLTAYKESKAGGSEVIPFKVFESFAYLSRLSQGGVFLQLFWLHVAQGIYTKRLYSAFHTLS